MTTRAFTVEVTGCTICPYYREEWDSSLAQCSKVFRNQVTLVRENKDGITESCPMFDKSFVKDKKKWPTTT
jgi:hypothetical protein